MADNVDHGMSARHVARRLAELLIKERLAPHYVIGAPVQRLSTLARRLLPGRAWEWVLSQYYR